MLRPYSYNTYTINLFDRAMTAYTGALRTAERNLLDDKAGYINSYMGDLYSEDRRTKFFLSLSNWRGRRVPWLLSRRKTRVCWK